MKILATRYSGVCTTVLVAAFLCISLLVGACSDSSDSTKPNPYTADELWLCKPGLESDACLDVDLTTTYVYSELSTAVFEHTPAVDPDYDCFFVYPTVDLNEEPGNTEDLTDHELILPAVYLEAARFTELCNLYVPLYHQMTAGVYTSKFEGGYRSTGFYDIAFKDVKEAFGQYLRGQATETIPPGFPSNWVFLS